MVSFQISYWVRHSLLAICLLLVAPIATHACELCGCGNNNFQIGILPTFSKGFVGLRYSVSQFNSSLRGDASQFSHDYYQSTEIWGGYNLKKFQVMAFLPYVNSRKVSDDGTTRSAGIGDALVLVNYKIWTVTSLSKNEKVTVRNEIYLGGGLKLPTGVNQVDTQSTNFNIGDFNSQAGTGSVDYLINFTHNMIRGRHGVVTNVAYRINSANRQEFRFGNRTYLNSSYYYTFSVAGIKIKPSAGLNFQSNDTNSYLGSKVENSNGYNLNSTAGINILYGKIGVNAMSFIPVAQNFYDGQTKLASRLIMGLTYSF